MLDAEYKDFLLVVNGRKPFVLGVGQVVEPKDLRNRLTTEVTEPRYLKYKLQYILLSDGIFTSSEEAFAKVN